MSIARASGEGGMMKSYLLGALKVVRRDVWIGGSVEKDQCLPFLRNNKSNDNER